MDPRGGSKVRTSKLLSLMLRHRPEEFGLELDKYGYGDVNEVLAAIQERVPGTEMEDVEDVVYDSEKQRFEIAEGRIRARYGHSFPIELGVDPTEPPEYLYKGVASSELDYVLSNGIRPFDRQFVHLSFDSEVAGRLVGPVGTVVRIEALRAHNAGVHFYDCGPTVLSAEVPSEYLAAEGPAPSETRAPAESESPAYGRRRRFGGRR